MVLLKKSIFEALQKINHSLNEVYKIVEDTNFGVGFQKKKISSLLAMVTIGHCPVFSNFYSYGSQSGTNIGHVARLNAFKSHPRSSLLILIACIRKNEL